MTDQQSKYFRFVRLRLRGYKIFGSINDFKFNQERTLITGDNGFGKTIVVEVLERLGPSRRTLPLRTVNSSGVSSVAVITEGDCDLIKKYGRFIFISRESLEYLIIHRKDPAIINMLPENSRGAVASKARLYFQSIIYHKPWKMDLRRNINNYVDVMAAGERICFGFAFVFAVREALKLDVPLVLDSPYAMLDEYLRKGLHKFLKAQSCQQILLGHECEFKEEERPKYTLVHVEDYSYVMEY